MKFDIEKKGYSQAHKYQKDDIDVAFDFAKEAYEEFKEFTRGIILFGSSAKKTQTEESDIDILIVVDDVTINLSKELMEAYRIISQKLIVKISPRIHTTTIKYSTFMDYVRTGDPLGVNILRDGVALIDTGFFDPLQALLQRGKIQPTFESTWAYFNRAPSTLNNSRWHLFTACEDLYWAVSDAAQAALMKQGIVPPSPDTLANMVDVHLVSHKLISKEQVKTVQFFYDLYKKIHRKQLRDITGVQYEKYYAQAQRFVQEVERFLKSKK